jgi:hypothetical protein
MQRVSEYLHTEAERISRNKIVPSIRTARASGYFSNNSRNPRGNKKARKTGLFKAL